MRITMIAAIVICGFMVTAGSAIGSSEWVASIPNGAVKSCLTCHTSIPALNNFGTDFLATNPSDPLWTVALAGLDSDSDTFANGLELQDVAGTWIMGEADPGDPDLVSNPGDGESTGVDGTTWGQIKATYK